MTCLPDQQSFGKLLISKKCEIYIYSICFKVVVVEQCKVCKSMAVSRHFFVCQMNHNS